MLEAGPDFGSYADGGWPRDVLDATWLAESHQLGYASDDGYRGRRVEFPRAGMIGGCSSHNGCAAIWGSALDYDGLAPRGLDGLVARRGRAAAAGRERAHARAHPRGGRAGAVPPRRPGLARRARRAARRTTSTISTPTRASRLARQHRRRRALERRPRLSRPRARAAVAADLRRRPGRAPARRRAAACAARSCGARASRYGRGGARDRVRRRLRLPRAAAALGHRAGRRPAGARHPRRRPICPASARTSTTIRRSSSASQARPSCDAACADYAAERRIRPDRGRDREARSRLCAAAGFDLHVYPVGGVVPSGARSSGFPSPA